MYGKRYTRHESKIDLSISIGKNNDSFIFSLDLPTRIWWKCQRMMLILLKWQDTRWSVTMGGWINEHTKRDMWERKGDGNKKTTHMILIIIKRDGWRMADNIKVTTKKHQHQRQQQQQQAMYWFRSVESNAFPIVEKRIHVQFQWNSLNRN